MNDKSDWWDNFWAKQAQSSVDLNGNCETWYDLVWNETLNHWYSLFEKFTPGREMLECGCGSAKVSQYMAQRGYRCTLLDYSEQAIANAKSKFVSQSLYGNFVVGDINNMHFKDEQFDVVFSGGVLEFFEDIERPVSEMVRVLKPGGIFAADIVPRKFSVQTIADLERTFVYSTRNLLKGRFKDVFRRIRTVPLSYHVNSLSLEDYIDVCKKAGLTSVVGLVTRPFPEISLPHFAKRYYARTMRMFMKQWRSFNESNSFLTKIWGITYTVYGIKGG